MKTYVITLSQSFLQGHPKAGQPTYFTEQFLLGQGQTLEALPAEFKAGLRPKIHTIRGNYTMWAKRIAEVQAGEAVLSVRRWLGVPYRSKQVEIARLAKEDGVGVQRIEMHKPNPAYICWNIDDRRKPYDLDIVAQNDGLPCDDFVRWFFPDRTKADVLFVGAIIHFTPFRY